jgi:hypothetical protein
LADDRTPDTGIAAAFDFNKRRKVIFRNSSAGTSKAPVLDWLVKSTVVPFNRFPRNSSRSLSSSIPIPSLVPVSTADRFGPIPVHIA